MMVIHAEPNFFNLFLFFASFFSTFDSCSYVLIFLCTVGSCLIISFFVVESTKMLSCQAHAKKVDGKRWYLLIEFALSWFQWLTVIILCSATDSKSLVMANHFFVWPQINFFPCSCLVQNMHHYHHHHTKWYTYNKIEPRA